MTDGLALKISIVTVTYNAEKTIEKTIFSVINQSYHNIEFIIIDGSSTDGTIEILKKHEEYIAYWCSEPDNGVYDAMNKGLAAATGDFLLFLGGDDVLFSSRTIEHVAGQLKDNYIYYGNVLMMPLNKIYWGRFSKYKLGIGNICHQSIFYPRLVYKHVKYSLSYPVFADYHYNITLFNYKKFIYLDATITIYNCNGISSQKRDLAFERDIRRLVITHLGYTSYLIRRIYYFLLYLKSGFKKVI